MSFAPEAEFGGPLSSLTTAVLLSAAAVQSGTEPIRLTRPGVVTVSGKEVHRGLQFHEDLHKIACTVNNPYAPNNSFRLHADPATRDWAGLSSKRIPHIPDSIVGELKKELDEAFLKLKNIVKLRPSSKDEDLEIVSVQRAPSSVSGEYLDRFLEVWGAATLADARPRLRILWHGTAQKNVAAIAATNLDPFRRGGKTYGEGEYFGIDFDASLPYAEHEAAEWQMLLFAVIDTPEDVNFLDCIVHAAIARNEAYIPLAIVDVRRV